MTIKNHNPELAEMLKGFNIQFKGARISVNGSYAGTLQQEHPELLSHTDSSTAFIEALIRENSESTN